MNGKKVWDLLNGKKTPIALIILIVTGSVGYGELKNTVNNNCKELAVLKPAMEQVARIDERVEGIEEDVGEIKLEQRIIQSDIKEILREVRKNNAN